MSKDRWRLMLTEISCQTSIWQSGKSRKIRLLRQLEFTTGLKRASPNSVQIVAVTSGLIFQPSPARPSPSEAYGIPTIRFEPPPPKSRSLPPLPKLMLNIFSSPHVLPPPTFFFPFFLPFFFFLFLRAGAFWAPIPEIWRRYGLKRRHSSSKEGSRLAKTLNPEPLTEPQTLNLET